MPLCSAVDQHEVSEAEGGDTGAPREGQGGLMWLRRPGQQKEGTALQGIPVGTAAPEVSGQDEASERQHHRLTAVSTAITRIEGSNSTLHSPLRNQPSRGTGKFRAEPEKYKMSSQLGPKQNKTRPNQTKSKRQGNAQRMKQNDKWWHMSNSHCSQLQ